MYAPTLLLLLASCGLSTPPDVELDGWVDAFPALHREVYELFNEPASQDVIHEALSRIFTGDALTQAYVRHWTTRQRMVEEGTAINIRKVDYASVQALQPTPEGRRIDVDWSIGGIVTHRQHAHPRVNRYRAIFTLTDTQDGPRITSTRMRHAERVRDLLASSPDGWILDTLPKGEGGFLDPLDLLEAGVLDQKDTP